MLREPSITPIITMSVEMRAIATPRNGLYSRGTLLAIPTDAKAAARQTSPNQKKMTKFNMPLSDSCQTVGKSEN